MATVATKVTSEWFGKDERSGANTLAQLSTPVGVICG
jgi:hypothetical protein